MRKILVMEDEDNKRRREAPPRIFLHFPTIPKVLSLDRLMSAYKS
jgi:hypothetical protein